MAEGPGRAAVVFSWSGSFRDDFGSREEDITDFIATMHDRGTEVGIIGDEPRDELEGRVDVDFALGHVDDILAVLTSFAEKYETVFFVSDVRAELAAVNRSGAFTVGFNSDRIGADDLGGVGPNYIVDSLGELAQILLLEDSL